MIPRRSRASWLVGMLAVCLTAGCATQSYEVKVDAITKPEPSGAQSYVLKSKNPVMGEENLRYREAAELVKTALSGKGLYEAPDKESADMVVELDFGLDAPRTKLEHVSTPIYAQVGGGVRYETVQVKDAKGNVTQRTVAVYESPRTELIGYEEMPRHVTIYEKYLHITARENKPASEGRPPAELWSVHASAEDESKDLRKYLPLMASATIDHIGADTSQQKVVKVRVDSPGVEFVKKGMGEPANTAVAEPGTGSKS